MAARSPDIKVNVSMNGVREAISGLRRLRAVAQVAGGAMSTMGAGIGSDIARIRSLTGSVTKLGTIAAGIGVGSFLGLQKGLEAAENIADRTAKKLNELELEAEGMNLRDATAAGALQYAAEIEGMGEDFGDVRGLMVGLMAAVKDYKDGSEGVQQMWHELGASEDDIINRTTGQVHDAETLLLNLARLTEKLPDTVNRTAVFLPIGDTDAALAARLFGQGEAAMRGYLEEYRNVTQLYDEDIDRAGDYVQSAVRRKAAIFGVENALTQGLIPALIESNDKWTDFFFEHPRAFTVIGQEVGELKSAMTDLSIAATDALIDAVAGNEMSEDTPIARIIRSIVGLVTEVSTGIIDFSRYLTTGEMPTTGWVVGAMTLFDKIKTVVISAYGISLSLAGTFNDKVIPAAEAVIGWIDRILTALGVGETGDQIAIVVGLVAFSGTLTGLIKVIAGFISMTGIMGTTLVTTISGVATAALAAAGIAATIGGGLAGAAVVVKSADDMAQAMAQASRDAKRLAETEGEAYAAAYVAAFIREVPDQYRGAALGNWMASGIDGLFGTNLAPDYDTALIQLDYIASQGSADEVVRGTAAAFARYGWDVDESGTVRIDAGISVSGAEFSEIVEQELANISGIIQIDDIRGLDAMAEKIKASIEQVIALPDLTHTSEQLMLAAPGSTAPAGMHPVTINIGGEGGRQVDVYATPDQVEALRQGASQSARARS